MKTRLKKPLPDTHVFRLRIDLDRSKPVIWRRLEVRSDASLGQLHEALQAAFEWYDCHLHQFALGAKVFWPESQPIVAAADADDLDTFAMSPELEDAPVETDVRLDETMHKSGDKLYYVYDFGDDWGLTIKLEAVLDVDDATPVARCTGGRRFAPPEDCGSLRTAEELQEILDDPELQDWYGFDPGTIDLARFDIDGVNEALDDMVNSPLEE